VSEMSIADAELQACLDKWRGRWPEWRIAQAFIDPSQRETAEAWFALLQEWTDAAWAGDDPTPGFAKLGWWQEELIGWSKGARRHPLGSILQKRSAGWATLAAELAALRALREPLRAWAEPEALLPQMQTLCSAIADCEQELFAAQSVAAGDAFALLAAHVLWHREEAVDAHRAVAWTQRLAATALLRASARPRRIHDALTRARLRRIAADGGIPALSPMAALWHSWRAARG
jgi:phytoene/squalene synthetase